jgi:hypothetical protein
MAMFYEICFLHILTLVRSGFFTEANEGLGNHVTTLVLKGSDYAEYGVFKALKRVSLIDLIRAAKSL